MSGVQNKKVLVTGTSRGIGLAIAKEFLSQGAQVYGTATTKGSAPHRVFWFLRSGFLESARVFNNAWISLMTFNQTSLSIMQESIPRRHLRVLILKGFLEIQQVNVLAPMEICRAAIPHMVSKNWGRIVNISSVWSKISKEHRAPYSASKFALDGMTLALAIEYAKHNVLANCIAPGFVDTDMTRGILGDEGINKLMQIVPIGRLAQPAEIATFVVWLASESNTYITGQNIAVDGGFHPCLIQSLFSRTGEHTRLASPQNC